MLKIFLLFFCAALILCVQNSYAQISDGGQPISYTNTIQKNISKVIPVISMPAIDVNKCIAEDLRNDNDKSIPWRFGENIDMNIDVIHTGVKDILVDGTKIWRLQIYSQGALTLNFRFNKYLVPPRSKLFIYNPETKKTLGAFTAFNNQDDGIFATTLIEGESMIIEYEEPENAAFQGELILDRITHGYRNAFEYAKIFGSSGSCNKNVACAEGNGWENQIRSVCMLVVNSSGFCSGALINNSSNDGTPYVLTAYHCTSSHPNFSSWIFWFNWQSSTCTNPATSPQHQSISGCTLKARKSTSDFCLVQMNNTPPTSYNVFYSGWNHSGNNTPNGACIHHPNGDIKKITLAGDSIKPEMYESIQTWRANWTAGVTEPGSSGSPLFDAQHRIIGQLYGGPSGCGTTANNMNDFYGMISVSWNDTSADRRLKDWLDPINTGIVYIDGFDPKFSIPFSETFENTNFPPAGWGINNPDNTFTWEQNHTIGFSENKSAYINHFANSSISQIDELLSPTIILPLSHAELTFQIAYRKQNFSSSDTLKIYVSTDGGFSFPIVPALFLTADSLASGPILTTEFLPSTMNDWKKITIPLFNFSGNNIKIKFTSISGNGNNIFIDDISINYSVGMILQNESDIINFSPNPTTGILHFSSTEKSSFNVVIIDNSGIIKEQLNDLKSGNKINLDSYSNGIYFLHIKSNGKQWMKKIIIIR